MKLGDAIRRWSRPVPGLVSAFERSITDVRQGFAGVAIHDSRFTTCRLPALVIITVSETISNRVRAQLALHGFHQVNALVVHGYVYRWLLPKALVRAPAGEGKTSCCGFKTGASAYCVPLGRSRLVAACLQDCSEMARWADSVN